LNTEQLNIIYFPSRQHEYNMFTVTSEELYNMFTVTSEELFVYKSGGSAINIGFLNK